MDELETLRRENAEQRSQIAQLIAELARLNERVAALLAVAQRKQRKTAASYTMAKRLEDLSGVSKIMRDQERMMRPFKAAETMLGSLRAVDRLSKFRF